MSFSSVKNVRIKSLTPGSVVQLRLGKTAVRSANDVVIEAKLVRHYDDGPQSFMEFEETNPDGQTSKTTISHFPGAPWKEGSRYVSLLAVDPSTFTIQQSARPVETDAIGVAIGLIEKESEDVFASEQLVALLVEIKDGKRVNTNIKSLALRLANKLVDELSALEPPKDDAEA